MLKAVAEAQLFLTLLISIVLRFSEDVLDKDALDEDQYGTLLVVAFFSAPSVAAFVTARKAVAFLTARKKSNDGAVHTEEPPKNPTETDPGEPASAPTPPSKMEAEPEHKQAP